MRRGAWAAFWLLGLIWGSSFLLIRIAVQEMNPLQLVLIRTGIAAIGLNVLLLMRGGRYPTNWRALVGILIVGLGNTAIPFVLISWGETIIESSIASILQSTASLFTLVVAHFFFADERITLPRIAGMILGFVGVVVLFSGQADGGTLLTATFWGMAAVVVASLFYAIFTVYSRTVIRQNVQPLAMSAGSMVSAALFMLLCTFGAPLVGGPAPVDLRLVSAGANAAAITLGVVNSFAAYALFYNIIDVLGAARASMVTYIAPFVGVVLGVVFLSEPLTASLVIGSALILAGIGVVNLPVRKPKPTQAALQAAD